MNEQGIRPGSLWAHRETGRRVTVVGLSSYGETTEYSPEFVVYTQDSSPDRLMHNACQSFLWYYRPVVIDEPKRLYVSPTGKFYDASVLDARGPGDQTIELNPDGTWTVVEG